MRQHETLIAHKFTSSIWIDDMPFVASVEHAPHCLEWLYMSLIHHWPLFLHTSQEFNDESRILEAAVEVLVG